MVDHEIVRTCGVGWNVQGVATLSDDIRERLIRIDERTKAMNERMELRNRQVDAELEQKVSKDEFSPIKSIVYGGVGVILMSVIGAILTLVIKGTG